MILLHHSSQRLGRLKFWSLLIIPLSDSSIYAVIVPLVNQQQIPDLSFISISKNRQILPKYFWIFASGNTAGIIFGIPFLTIARNIRHSLVIRDYLVIAGFGLFLFEMSVAPQEGTATAPYPPLGLASVLFAGLS